MFVMDFKGYATLGSVLTLIGLGLIIVVRSGGSPLATTVGIKQVALNLTRTVVLVTVWLLIMLFAQRLAGYNLALR